MISSLLSAFIAAQLLFAGPKYGPVQRPKATPLYQKFDYFQRTKATDFFRLISYYVPQLNNYACSAASISIILNAAKTTEIKTTDTAVISQKHLLDTVKAEHWAKRLRLLGYKGSHGTSLEILEKIVQESFKKNGFPNTLTQKEHVTEITPQIKQKVEQMLIENEKNSEDFILVNFNQRSFTDDTDAGHISPVGAYDETHKQVLILDTDREYYEPYWISLDTLLEGMHTMDSGSKKYRGYVWVKTNKSK